MGVIARWLLVVFGLVLVGCIEPPNEQLNSIRYTQNEQLSLTQEDWTIQENDSVYYERREPSRYGYKVTLKSEKLAGAYGQVLSDLAEFEASGLIGACIPLLLGDDGYLPEYARPTDVGFSAIIIISNNLERRILPCRHNEYSTPARAAALSNLVDQIKWTAGIFDNY